MKHPFWATSVCENLSTSFPDFQKIVMAGSSSDGALPHRWAPSPVNLSHQTDVKIAGVVELNFSKNSPPNWQ